MKEESLRLPETFHASAEKASEEIVNTEFQQLSSDLYFQMFTEAMPDIAAVVNPQRQVVYANKSLLELIGETDIESVIGLRTGELLNCVNLNSETHGCGTTKACRYCGVVNSILETQQTGKSSVHECRITSAVINEGQSFDVEVKASPIPVGNQVFIILSIKDISDKKRRQVLEKLFFHDILNTAAGLNGILSVIEDQKSEEETKAIINFAKKTGCELVDEIVAQQVLISAENSDLELNVVRCNSLQILQDVSAYLSYHEVASGKKIFIDPFSHMSQFESDPLILKRVLINAVKNALEASDEGAVIRIGTKIVNRHVNFWINNPGVIPEYVQSQLFQRSFSTKGINRGIGTYSIKLLTTRYLKGSVTFKSEMEEGTTFFINIPHSLK